MSRDIQARRFARSQQSYREGVRSLKEGVEGYLSEKEAYEQRLKTWKKKYEPYLTKRGRSEEFRRKYSPRLVAKLKGEYKETISELTQKGQQLSQKYTDLKQSEEQLKQERKELQQQAAKLERAGGEVSYDSVSQGPEGTSAIYEETTPFGTKKYYTGEDERLIAVEDPILKQSRLATGSDILSFGEVKYRQRRMDTAQSPRYEPTFIDKVEESILSTKEGKRLFTPTHTPTPDPFFQQTVRDYPKTFQKVERAVTSAEAKVSRKVLSSDVGKELFTDKTGKTLDPPLITPSLFRWSEGITGMATTGYGLLSTKPSQTAQAFKESGGIIGGVKQQVREFERDPLGSAGKLTIELALLSKAAKPLEKPLMKVSQPIIKITKRGLRKVVPSKSETIIPTGGPRVDTITYYGKESKPFVEVFPQAQKATIKTAKDVGVTVSKIDTGLVRVGVDKGWFGRVRGVKVEPIKGYTMGVTKEVGGIFRTLPSRQAEIFRKTATQQMGKPRYSVAGARPIRGSRLRVASRTDAVSTQIGGKKIFSSRGVAKSKVRMDGRQIQRTGKVTSYFKETQRIQRKGKPEIVMGKGFGTFKPLYRIGKTEIAKVRGTTIGRPRPPKKITEIRMDKLKARVKPREPILDATGSVAQVKELFVKTPVKTTTRVPVERGITSGALVTSKPVPLEWRGVYDVPYIQTVSPRAREGQLGSRLATGMKSDLKVASIIGTRLKTRTRQDNILGLRQQEILKTGTRERNILKIGYKSALRTSTKQKQRVVTKRALKTRQDGFAFMPPGKPSVPKIPKIFMPFGEKEKKVKPLKKLKIGKGGRDPKYAPSLIAVSEKIITKKKQLPVTSGLPIRPMQR